MGRRRPDSYYTQFSSSDTSNAQAEHMGSSESACEQFVKATNCRPEYNYTENLFQWLERIKQWGLEACISRLCTNISSS